MSETEQGFAQSMDAVVWAKAFVKIVREKPDIPTDEATMIGWFANAIMRGWDEHANRQPDRIAAAEARGAACRAGEVEKIIDALIPDIDAYPEPFLAYQRRRPKSSNFGYWDAALRELRRRLATEERARSGTAQKEVKSP